MIWMTWMLILGGLASYLVLGTFCASIRAWFVGSHRATHGGTRSNGCEHWACDSMATDVLVLTVAFWPVFVPGQLCMLLIHKILRAPYLRSLPPKGAADQEAEMKRELLDAALGIGRVEYLTGGGMDSKWVRLDNALKAMLDHQVAK